jgi:hypothetical protein
VWCGPTANECPVKNPLGTWINQYWLRFPYTDLTYQYRWNQSPFILGSIDGTLLNHTRVRSDLKLYRQFTADVITEDWKQYLGTDYPINNPYVTVKINDISVTSHFIKVCIWSDATWYTSSSYPWTPIHGYRESSVLSVVYLRVIALGVFSTLAAQLGLPFVLGEPSLPTDDSGNVVIDYNTGWLKPLAGVSADRLVLAKAKAGKGVTSALTSVLELKANKELLRSFKPRMKKLLRNLLPYVKGRKKHTWRFDQALKFKNLSAMVSNNYLESKYGWYQLYLDMSGFVRGIYKALTKIRVTYTYGTTLPARQFLTSEIPFGVPDGTGSISYSVAASARVWAGCGLRHDMLDTKTKRIFHNLGRANLLYTYWDKLPLTFVLDWFLNIGALLTIAGVNPRLYARAWTSFQVEPGAGLMFASGEISETDLYGTFVAANAFNSTELQDLYLLDEEALVAFSDSTLPFTCKVRIPFPPHTIPATIPSIFRNGLGVGLSQALDMLALLRQRLFTKH